MHRAGYFGEFVLLFSSGSASAGGFRAPAASTRLLSFRTAAPTTIKQLTVTQQPSGVDVRHPTARVGNFLATQPIVKVVDGAGNGVPGVIVSRCGVVPLEP